MANIKLKRKQKKDKSNKWLERHLNDYFFIQAKKKGLRSRSSFKLMQINQKFNFFFKGASVLDLGAAPGGWSQISKKLVGRKGKVLGIDKISIEPINDIKFLKIDFSESKVFNLIIYPMIIDKGNKGIINQYSFDKILNLSSII